MAIRHVDGAGAEPDLLGRGRKPRDEGDAGGDVLRLVGDVLADIAFRKAQFVGKQEGFAVLLQGLPPILLEGWIGIVKNPSFMVCSSARAGFLIGRTCVARCMITSPKVKGEIITR